MCPELSTILRRPIEGAAARESGEPASFVRDTCFPARFCQRDQFLDEARQILLKTGKIQKCTTISIKSHGNRPYGLSYQARPNRRILFNRTGRFAGIGGSIFFIDPAETT